MKPARHPVIPCSLLALMVASAAPVRAEKPPRTWTDEAELSLLLTNGNSETLTLGLANELEGKWERWSLRWKLAAVRADATTRTRTAVGTPSAFDVDESSDTKRTAESYLVDLRCDRALSERVSLHVGFAWNRNELAGIRNRSTVLAGFSRKWIDTSRAFFRTDHVCLANN